MTIDTIIGIVLFCVVIIPILLWVICSAIPPDERWPWSGR